MGGAGGSYWAICWLFYVQVLFIRHSGPRLYPLIKSVGHQTSFLSCPTTYDAHKNTRWSKRGGASWGFASRTALTTSSRFLVVQQVVLGLGYLGTNFLVLAIGIGIGIDIRNLGFGSWASGRSGGVGCWLLGGNGPCVGCSPVSCAPESVRAKQTRLPALGLLPLEFC
jgi:hypothetical protein